MFLYVTITYQLEKSVPKDANVVLCPPQDGCKYPNPALAACGVSLKVAQNDVAKNEQL